MHLCKWTNWVDVTMVDFNSNFLIQVSRCTVCNSVRFAYRKVPVPAAGRASISIDQLHRAEGKV